MLDQFFSQISFIDIFNFSVFAVFTICYTYQLFYVLVVLTRKPKEHVAKKNHRFAVVVSARNESAVIGDLIHSIKVQNYPAELIDVFVIADNCTDNTAEVAREAGAIVFPRHNTEQVGKGYALDYGFYGHPRRSTPTRGYEAYFVFDADNVLDVNYFREMNKTFDAGAKASTSYRNSKNYGSNWISAGYAAVVPARGQVPQPGAPDAQHQLRHLGHGLLHRRRRHRESGRLEVAPAHRGHRVLRDQHPAGRAHRLLRPRRSSTTSSPSPSATRGTSASAGRRASTRCSASTAARLVKGIFTNPKGHRFACYDMLMTIAPGMLLTIVSVPVQRDHHRSWRPRACMSTGITGRLLDQLHLLLPVATT